MISHRSDCERKISDRNSEKMLAFTLSAPAGRRGRGGLGGTNSFTLYQTESINLKHSLNTLWRQNKALNLKALSYYRLASSSGGLLGTSGFSIAISIMMYDLESVYIWDNNKRDDHTLPRLYISYLTASFWCIRDGWTDLSFRVHRWLQSSHTFRLSRFSLGIWL